MKEKYLLSFKVKNFNELSHSSNEKPIDLNLFNLNATQKNNYIKDNNDININKRSFIYAEDKTDKFEILNALKYMKEKIINNKLTGHFNNEAISEFNVILEIDNEIYDYGFKYDPEINYFTEEWVYKINLNAKNEVMFHRFIEFEDYISLPKYLTPDTKVILDMLYDKDNLLFITKSHELKMDNIYSDIYNFFAENLIILEKDTDYEGVNLLPLLTINNKVIIMPKFDLIQNSFGFIKKLIILNNNTQTVAATHSSDIKKEYDVDTTEVFINQYVKDNLITYRADEFNVLDIKEFFKDFDNNAFYLYHYPILYENNETRYDYESLKNSN